MVYIMAMVAMVSSSSCKHREYYDYLTLSSYDTVPLPPRYRPRARSRPPRMHINLFSGLSLLWLQSSLASIFQDRLVWTLTDSASDSQLPSHESTCAQPVLIQAIQWESDCPYSL